MEYKLKRNCIRLCIILCGAILSLVAHKRRNLIKVVCIQEHVGHTI